MDFETYFNKIGRDNIVSLDHMITICIEYYNIEKDPISRCFTAWNITKLVRKYYDNSVGHKEIRNKVHDQWNLCCIPSDYDRSTIYIPKNGFLDPALLYHPLDVNPDDFVQKYFGDVSFDIVEISEYGLCITII